MLKVKQLTGYASQDAYPLPLLNTLITIPKFVVYPYRVKLITTARIPLKYVFSTVLVALLLTRLVQLNTALIYALLTQVQLTGMVTSPLEKEYVSVPVQHCR